MSNARNSNVVAAAVALAALGACASTPKSQPDVSAARALISQAEQGEAQQFASADLEAARSKLRQADQYQHEDKPILASQSASEAQVDAEVAIARSRAIKAEQALAEVNAGTRTLDNESQRQAVPPTSSATPMPSSPVVQSQQP